MLKSITWTDYITFIVGLALVYYAIIIFLYYRLEIKLLFAGKLHLIGAGPNRKVNNPSTTPIETNQTSELINSLSATIQAAAANFYSKTELIDALKNNMDGHPQLREDKQQEAVINFITRESRNQCSIHLAEEDLRGLLKNR